MAAGRSATERNAETERPQWAVMLRNRLKMKSQPQTVVGRCFFGGHGQAVRLHKEPKISNYANCFRFTEVARGKVTMVCVRHNDPGGMWACPIPWELAGKIEVAPAHLLDDKRKSEAPALKKGRGRLHPGADLIFISETLTLSKSPANWSSFRRLCCSPSPNSFLPVRDPRSSMSTRWSLLRECLSL